MTNPMMMKLMVLSLLVIMTGADEYLMKKECSNTEYPVVCVDCLKSDPTSYQSDLAGFARMNLYCLEYELKILAINVTFVGLKEVDPVKKVLDDCFKSLSFTSLGIRAARSSLVTRDYVTALESLKMGLSYPFTCRDNLYRLKFKKTLYIYEQVSVYAKHDSVTRTLIQRLKDGQ